MMTMSIRSPRPMELMPPPDGVALPPAGAFHTGQPAHHRVKSHLGLHKPHGLSPLGHGDAAGKGCLGRRGSRDCVSPGRHGLLSRRHRGFRRGGAVFWGAVTDAPERGAVRCMTVTGVPEMGVVGPAPATGVLDAGNGRIGAVRPAAGHHDFLIVLAVGTGRVFIRIVQMASSAIQFVPLSIPPHTF